VANERDYAVIRLDEGKIDVSQVSRMVSGVEGRPVVDVSTRIRASRGLLARDLEKDVAEGLAEVLGVRGIRCAVVPGECLEMRVKPRRCTELAVTEGGLGVKGSKFKQLVGWDELELVNCGLVRLLAHERDGGGGVYKDFAPIVGLSGLPGVAVGRRRYVRSVSEECRRLVIDVFAHSPDRDFRLYEGWSVVRVENDGDSKAGRTLGARVKRLAETVAIRAPRAKMGLAVALLAERKSLHQYSFTSEYAYGRYTWWLVQAERIARRMEARKEEERQGGCAGAEERDEDDGPEAASGEQSS